MDINNAIKILEMLAAGCSPATGEVENEESVLHQRDVIRALQIAIDSLKQKGQVLTLPVNNSTVTIEEDDIKAAIQLFEEQGNAPTKNRLTGFFLATRAFKNEELISNSLYGKYKKLYTNGQLQDFFAVYLSKNEYTRQEMSENQDAPWKDIDFFRKERFNNLSQADIDQLKERINELGVTKVDSLTPYMISERKVYPRAYEPWHETEKQLLAEALKHTNDIRLLTECFQRNKGSIKSCAKKIIYERGLT